MKLMCLSARLPQTVHWEGSGQLILLSGFVEPDVFSSLFCYLSGYDYDHNLLMVNVSANLAWKKSFHKLQVACWPLRLRSHPVKKLSTMDQDLASLLHG